MYVVGTAGHVDHGKSTLVKSLTGIDPDRLREEKDRGMTIDLGFAWLRMPSGLEVGIVDVPGHERFIKNMLAGVGGIDLALLVVAADEGVMPQTREHLTILDFLEVHRGVAAISKADLVDDEWRALVEADVRETLEGTVLAGSPVISCSAVTGFGLEDLIAALETALGSMPAKIDLGRPRLSVDRVFTVAGFGTVVTGTLVDGSLSVGQEVEILPIARRARIRGLQNHQRKVEVSSPGSRTAVNLIGVEKEEIERGMVVTTPGWLRPTNAVDVRLRAATGAPRHIRHNMSASFHVGASETDCKLLLLDCDEVMPGEVGWAQVRLEKPVAAIRGEFFVVRSPNDTIGGGRIIETHPVRHRRLHEPTIAALRQLLDGSAAALLLAALNREGPCEMGMLARMAEMSVEEAKNGLRIMIEEGRVVNLGDDGGLDSGAVVCTGESLAELTRSAKKALAAYHHQHPLRSGMSKEEMRSRLGLAAAVFSDLLATWLRHEEMAEAGSSLRLMDHRPRLSAEQEQQARKLLTALNASPYAPSVDSMPSPEVLAYLEDAGNIVRASDVVFSFDAYGEMVEKVTEYLREYGKITLAQVRDIFGTSRKYAQALVEQMDREHITRRVGDERVLRRSETRER